MGYRGTKYCTFDLLCIKNIPVVDVSAPTCFIICYYTAGKFAGSNLSGCTIAFVISKMKPLKAYMTRYTCTGQFLTHTNSYVLLCHNA